MAKRSELLTVVEVSEARQDKNGRNYKLVTFQTPQHKEVVDETTGEIMLVRMPARTSSITRYEESYLDDKMQYLYDAEVGEKVPGAIVTRSVKEYEIDGRPVSMYSTVVLGITNEPSFDSAVKSAFKSAGHEINEDRSVTLPVAERASAVKTTEFEPATEDAAF
jgi:hypothetical protein